MGIFDNIGPRTPEGKFDYEGLLGDPMLHAGIALLGTTDKRNGLQNALQGAQQGMQMRSQFGAANQKKEEQARQKALYDQQQADRQSLLGAGASYEGDDAALKAAYATGNPALIKQAHAAALTRKPVTPDWAVNPKTGQYYDKNAATAPSQPVMGDLPPDKDLIKHERELRQEFTKRVEPLRAVANNHKNLIASLGSNNGIGDVAATYGFVKSLDPTSVVRESEFGIAANAGGIVSRMENIIEKHKDGKFLPPEVKREMAQLSAQFAAIAQKTAESMRGDYQYNVGRYQMDDRAVLGSPYNWDMPSYSVEPATPKNPAGRFVVEVVE